MVPWELQSCQDGHAAVIGGPIRHWLKAADLFEEPRLFEEKFAHSVGRIEHRDEFEPLPISKVPPRVFSEVMRDMDLVVSVAHAGEVDPEATASTVEMRANLLRETCQLLNLKNVKLKDLVNLYSSTHIVSF